MNIYGPLPPTSLEKAAVMVVWGLGGIGSMATAAFYGYRKKMRLTLFLAALLVPFSVIIAVVYWINLYAFA